MSPLSESDPLFRLGSAKSRTLVFVGQGPNRRAWERGLLVGARLRPHAPELFASDYCERISLTGSVGTKLAELLGISRADFLKLYPRRNLNTRWWGKSGKGDGFDRAEATIRAAAIHAEFRDFVLLGLEVARAFGFKNPTALNEVVDRDASRSYFFLPHPSGVNLWWNDRFNRFRAERRLREYLLKRTNQ